MILRLFLVIAMYCQGSSGKIKSITQPLPLLAGWEGNLVHAVGSNSLETTYIIFELPYRTSAEKLCDWPGQWPGKVDHH